MSKNCGNTDLVCKKIKYLKSGKNSDILIQGARKEYLSEISQFKLSSEIFVLTVPWRTSFVDHLCFFVSCVSYAFASFHCCLVVTCWERADLLTLVGCVY